MYNGIVIINKEQGFTSFDVVAKLRGVFGQKKIGHTGTLDPDATGVLPVCLGNATKVCDMLTDSDKEYRAVLLLGIRTDTQDITGQILEEKQVTAGEKEVKEAIRSFTGTQLQIPPMYSALKVNGQKLCDLARAGKTVERKPREIRVYEAEILRMDLPRVEIRFCCSKGTYIRTLCNDIGERLGCGGCMESLVRTSAAGFGIEEAVKLEVLQRAKEEGRLEAYVKSTDTVFLHLPKAVVDRKYDVILNNGNRLKREFFTESDFRTEPERIRVYGSDGKFRAVYRYEEAEKGFRPVKMFLE
ncbi:MAG TPA: tRNA pseudouridine(55) synthase TruB [Candidatus Eubacterium avistercoris]|uniref:tRNA pseudouridine synthase B n=1 Tax=Candidatus Eubacterium avistercoris TaxID=2838567 RepID=A0A9D2D195_9FIRM|nr:tRNA pseudouridine(55) synthase TruB [Candidatus Eubacterium avistercoris]